MNGCKFFVKYTKGKNMKILILANNDVGLYKFRGELIQELLKRHKVIISLPYGELVEPLKKQGCQFINTPIDRRGKNPILDFKLFLTYRKILKEESPDFIITYTIKPNIYGGYLSGIFKIPYIVNVTGLGSVFERGGILKRIIIRMYKCALKNSRAVFFENEENRQIFISEEIVRENIAIRLMGAGVNTEKYVLTEYPQGKKIKFLYMGRVMAEKGVNELFEAMKRLIEEGIDCELDIIGEFEENYKEKVKRYELDGWLHYHGYQKDVRPYIEKCHCLVLPSWHEGMSNTNLEGASSGRPVITSRVAGCMESVINGKTGYIFEKKNVNDLYRVMRKFIFLSYEKKKEMGVEGRKYIEKVFDRKKVIEQTLLYIKETNYEKSTLN